MAVDGYRDPDVFSARKHPVPCSSSHYLAVANIGDRRSLEEGANEARYLLEFCKLFIDFVAQYLTIQNRPVFAVVILLSIQARKGGL